MEDYFYLNTPNNIIPENLSTRILQAEDPLTFHQSLPNYAPTPLHALPNWAKKHGLNNVYLKDESFRLGLNAFKGLGASYAIHKLLATNPQIQTFCTATDGNHGRAVAWASTLQGKHARIFVPRNTSIERIRAIEQEGAKVVETNKDYDEACQIAKQEAEKNGWALVQDTAWEGYEEIPAYIMAGYTTIMQEAFTQLPEKVDLVVLQAGVGSWAAAAIWYVGQHYHPRPKMLLVEPSASDGVLVSFLAGQRTLPTGNLETIMAGLNCGIPSLSAWEIIRNCADAALKIEDQYVETAMNDLYKPLGNDPSIIAGESGAAGLAGLQFVMTEAKAEALRVHLGLGKNSRVMVISTEGATDKESFQRITGSTVV